MSLLGVLHIWFTITGNAKKQSDLGPYCFYSRDLLRNSPYYMPYNSYDDNAKN